MELVKDRIRAYFGKEGAEDTEEGRRGLFEELKKHLIETGDGSYTLPSEERLGKTENMHDLDGGFLEAREKFFLPCRIRHGSKILDLFSGLGYNAAYALNRADVEIRMVEVSPELLALCLVLEVPEEYTGAYRRVRGAAEEALYGSGFLRKRMWKGDPMVSVSIGDAREVVKLLPHDTFDAVFFDPFSPGISPGLYTPDFLSDIKQAMSGGAAISTFSTSRILRNSLEEAGFEDIQKFRTHRKEGTVAFKNIPKKL